MERLTSKDTNKVCFDTWELCGLDNVCKRDCWKPTPCKIPNIVYGLAAYEDTELTPEEIINYRDIVNKKYSWNSLMQQLDDCYPAKIYTGISGDIGPLIIVKLREIDVLRRQAK